MVTSFQFIPLDQKDHPHANYFWTLEGKASKEKPYIHSVVPNGVCALLYIYKGSFKTSSSNQIFRKGDLVIGGQMDVLGKYVLDEDFGVFATCLQPYVVPILLSISGNSILNNTISCNTFPQLLEIQRKLRLTKSNEERMSLMIPELKSIGNEIEKSDTKFSGLVKKMRKLNPKDLQEVVTESAVSIRHFQRMFKEFTGFTPLQFLRIARLQPILDKANPKNLTSLAHKFGYYDQSHFINDFKKITGGITPSQYFAGLEELKWKTVGESVAYFQS